MNFDTAWGQNDIFCVINAIGALSVEIGDSNEEKICVRNRRRCTRSCNKVGVVGVIAQVPRYGKRGEKGTLAAAVARSNFNELKRRMINREIFQ